MHGKLNTRACPGTSAKHAGGPDNYLLISYNCCEMVRAWRGLCCEMVRAKGIISQTGARQGGLMLQNGAR